MRWLVLIVLLLGTAFPAQARGTSFDTDEQQIQQAAERLERLHSLLVLVDGEPAFEHVVRGPGLDTPVNIKSLSKTILAALVGSAIDRNLIAGVDQPVIGLLRDRVPDDASPGVHQITVGNLLSMQSGLKPTFGNQYGAWVNSDNWVAYVLRQPFVGEPGGRMRYSTGNSHLLSAALVEQTGRSTLSLAREWLGAPLGITIPDWMQDPQGIHFGGNQMRLSPRALARFGEMVRAGGTWEGQEILSSRWIERSWIPRGRSQFHNGHYGYGWFITELAGYQAYYGWGFGGQALYLLPELAMTVVMISDPTPPSPGHAPIRELEGLILEYLIPAVD